jgi:hypothetical protein
MIDFETLKVLSGGAAMADVPCPLCGPRCSTPAKRNLPKLRIWNERDDFVSFNCARCDARGSAYAISSAGGARRTHHAGLGKQRPIVTLFGDRGSMK